MYEGVKLSNRYKNNTKAFVEAAIGNYEDKLPEMPKKTAYTTAYESESQMVMESVMQKYSTSTRYHTFSESVRNAMVIEGLYNMYSKCVPEAAMEDQTCRNIMRAIVSEYVHENGYDTILNKMKYASTAMSELHTIITKNTKAMLEEVDKSNPDTFRITSDMKDEFFSQLNYNDSDAIADAIKSRVADSMSEFITANAKDHEDISAALAAAQEKIADAPADDNELQEAYQMQGKRAVNNIRNRPKNVFHAMVKSMSESVIKHQDSHAEFMVEGRLDMEKIVDRVGLMYTFMEMLNTARIENVDEAFIEGVIADLKK